MATAKGGRTSSEKANESNPTRWQQEARCQKKEGRPQDEEGAKIRKEKAALKEMKRKGQEDMLRRKGEKRTKNQPKILEWFRRKDEGQQKTRTGGKQGVG